jgi:hypothetical protein
VFRVKISFTSPYLIIAVAELDLDISKQTFLFSDILLSSFQVMLKPDYSQGKYQVWAHLLTPPLS